MRGARVIIGLCVFLGFAYSQEDCSENEFWCPVPEICIPKSMVCDGFIDCSGGHDEVNCPRSTTKCPGYTCPGSEACLPSHWVCDGEDDCGDGADEEGCSPTPCPGFLCDNGQCLPSHYQCNGYANCNDDSDEQNCPSTVCSGFQCFITGRCIPNYLVCDGYNNCGAGDFSDEEICVTTSTTPCPFFICPLGRCLPERYLCDGINHCGDYADETEELCPCPDDLIRCPQPENSIAPGPCIPEEYICDPDGIWDCTDGWDESNCTKTDDNILNLSRHDQPKRVLKKSFSLHKLMEKAQKE